jgi:hypothetical protein
VTATTGFLLGEFLPPHRGHQYLIEFARNYDRDPARIRIDVHAVLTPTCPCDSAVLRPFGARGGPPAAARSFRDTFASPAGGPSVA